MTNTSLVSGPFASNEAWITPIYNLFQLVSGSSYFFSWVLANPAVLGASIIFMLVMISYNWQLVSLFKEYIEERKKEVEYTLSDLESKYIKCKNLLIKSRL